MVLAVYFFLIVCEDVNWVTLLLFHKFYHVYPFTCQIVVKFTTANPGRKQEIVHEYHYNPLSASFI